MSEILSPWRDARGVVLVGVIAAAYAAILIPFKVATVIPGFTELRPANAIPVAAAILFGPAAAWGAALGNLIGDLFGTLSLGSLLGMVGNFLYGLIPFQVWRMLGGPEVGRKVSPLIRLLRLALGVLTVVLGYLAVRARAAWQDPLPLAAAICGAAFLVVLVVSIGRLLVAVVLASAACAGVIGWGIESLGIGPPFVALGNVIFLNNLVMSLALAPLLLDLLSRPVAELGLAYAPQPGPEPPTRRRPLALAGFLFLSVGALGMMVACNAVGLGIYHQRVLQFAGAPSAGPALAMGAAGAPFLILILVGCALL